MTALKFGRNEPCLCGSGKKFKKCCKTMEEMTRKVWANKDDKAAAELIPDSEAIMFEFRVKDQAAMERALESDSDVVKWDKYSWTLSIVLTPDEYAGDGDAPEEKHACWLERSGVRLIGGISHGADVDGFVKEIAEILGDSAEFLRTHTPEDRAGGSMAHVVHKLERFNAGGSGPTISFSIKDK